MSHSDAGQAPQGTGSEEAPSGAHSKQDRPGGPEMGGQPGNGTQQIVGNQASNTHMMKQVPGSAQMPQHTGASPQQQLPTQPQQGGPMPGLHFPNVPTTSQSSRPKTPNRASPRPYHHPLTPTNRPPSTEPSEINLSPERLNASIAGLFPPKINIPLPPRQPNLNRGFDQQGLNPTTLKAIGQAPPNLTLPGNNNGSAGGNNTNNNQQAFSAGSGTGMVGAKQDKPAGVQGKRASPSNSRRSSPASSRKSATPSPGRQKGAKMAVTGPPHQQQLVSPQGQTMMLSPTSVPPSPVSMASQVTGSMEAQQTQSNLHGIQGNPADGVRDSLGMITAEQRQIPQSQSQPQPLRELSAPRMTSPRLPAPQQPKTDLELQACTVDRQLTHSAPVQESEVSPAIRAAPTSLNQLLDNTGVPNMSLRTVQSSTVRDVMGKDSPKSAFDPERPLHSNSQSTDVAVSVANTAETEAKLKPAVPVPTSSPNLLPVSVPGSHPPNSMNSNTTPSLNQNPVSSLGVIPSSNVNATPTHTVSTNTNATTSVNPSTIASSQISSASTVSSSSNSSSAVNPIGSATKPSPSPKTVTSVHSVIQIPASSSTISPNQITVFVASNPITSAPASQPPTSMVSTMVAVPHRNIRPQDIRQQSSASRPPQFITTTPVFINPIFQVPSSSVAPNTTVVSQSVTMVGSIQVSNANIQLSAAPSSTQSSGTNMTSSQPTRNAVGQLQIATSMSSPAPAPPLGLQSNPAANKTESPGEAISTPKSHPVPQPSPHPNPSASPFQPPLASPLPCSSPGAVNTVRKSPVSSSPTAQLRSKPAQVAVAVSVTADSQQSPVERPAQGHTGAVPPQVFHPPASPAIQIEAQAPHTTAVSQNTLAISAVSSPVPVPGQVTAPTQIISQTQAHAPASVSTPMQAVTSQAPVVAVVGTPTGVSSSAVLSTVPLVQSPVPSIIPTLATPGPVREGSQTTSSPAANPSGVPAGQSDPATAVEPSIPTAGAAAETTQTTAGKRAAVSYINF